MRKNTTTVRIGSDGRMVRVQADGSEETLSTGPIAPRSAVQLEASAANDRDNPPLTKAQLEKVRRVPRVKTLRRALGLTQEEFAARYQIPLGTLRDWEQRRTEPDQAARAYLNVIAHDPQTVHRALRAGKGSSASPGQAAGSSRQNVKGRGRTVRKRGGR
jgi:putative transcriptional regulator